VSNLSPSGACPSAADPKADPSLPPPAPRPRYLRTRWRPIQGAPGFLVSTNGEVQDPNGATVEPLLRGDGFRWIRVKPNGKTHWFRLDLLVARTFLPPTPGSSKNARPVFLDDDPDNCRLSNLAWKRPSTTKSRPCIVCGVPFQSEGAHNQCCDPCRARNMRQSAYAF
jgi:hypothetical protein